ncbi:MAG: DUF4367 domain-containing protein [Nitrosotalea sp.]
MKDMKMNKKLLGIAASSVFALSLVVLVSFNTLTPPNENKTYVIPGNLPPAVPILKVIASKQVVSTQEATNQVGYEVKSPAYLPQGYKIQVISTDDHYNLTTMLASRTPITPETNNIDFFWKQGGVLIYMQPEPPSYDKQNFTSTWIRDNAGTAITINGQSGAVHDIVTGKDLDGNTVNAPADLVFFKGNVLISLHGMLSQNELIKIAESL